MTRAALNDYFGLAFICILAAVPVQAEPLLSPIAPGSWGGNHIRMIVTAEGAAIEYDCAWGTIDEPLLADRMVISRPVVSMFLKEAVRSGWKSPSLDNTLPCITAGRMGVKCALP